MQISNTSSPGDSLKILRAINRRKNVICPLRTVAVPDQVVRCLHTLALLKSTTRLPDRLYIFSSLIIDIRLIELFCFSCLTRSSASDNAGDEANCSARRESESSKHLSAGARESGNQSLNSPQVVRSEQLESSLTSFQSSESESSASQMATASQVSPFTLTTAATFQASTLIAQVGFSVSCRVWN